MTPRSGLRLCTALLLALVFPATIFERVLFAWQVLGNAFGPLLIVLLFVGPVAGLHRLAAMLTGAGLTIVLSLLPNAPGDAAERLIPFVLALTIALIGARRPPVPGSVSDRPVSGRLRDG
jgi:sodium/proline symporter